MSTNNSIQEHRSAQERGTISQLRKNVYRLIKTATDRGSNMTIKEVVRDARVLLGEPDKGQDYSSQVIALRKNLILEAQTVRVCSVTGRRATAYVIRTRPATKMDQLREHELYAQEQLAGAQKKLTELSEKKRRLVDSGKANDLISMNWLASP